MAPSHPSSRRVPRAGVDVISSPELAVRVVALRMSQPMQPETIVMPLDANGCGMTLVCVTGTTDRDAMIEVVDWITLSLAGSPDVAGIVVATVRPGGSFHISDLTTWHMADSIATDRGLTLYDWIVIGRGPATSVATASGEPSRWPGQA